MPKGVPLAGFRQREVMGNKLAGMKIEYHSDPNETDEQVAARLQNRFDILSQLTDACIKGYARALIVSGPPGLGKSFTVEKQLSEHDPSAKVYTIVKGYVRATGLIKTLYQFKEKNNVIVFDDADAIFFDDTSLALLKTVCDTTKKRVVSWLSEGSLINEETAERIPKTFEFNGTVVFITNYDFDKMISNGHKLATHLQALISRSHYIDLTMKTKRDYMVRIRQVVDQGILDFLEEDQKSDVMKFIDENKDKLRELSLRMLLKVGNLRLSSQSWENVAKVTCCRQ